MRNQAWFQLTATAGQVAYAQQLVAYSLERHRIANVWDGHAHQARTVELRFTGTLGEVVFADAYQLARPQRSFGADDGQDWGKDFDLSVDGVHKRFDLKSMRRQHNRLRCGYVLNIPASQLRRPGSLTDSYFHLNLHQDATAQFIASFIGYIDKDEILSGAVGKFYAAGTARTRADGTQFWFYTDTYEVNLGDLQTPPLTDFIRRWPGFAIRCLQ